MGAISHRRYGGAAKKTGTLPTKTTPAKRARRALAVSLGRNAPSQIKPRNEQIRPVDWLEYDALSMLHLNAQLQQFGCYTPGKRVYGRTPEMPIATVDNTFYNDFMNPKDSPFAQTHQAIAKLREIQNAL